MATSQLTETKKDAWRTFLFAHARLTQLLEQKLSQSGNVSLDVYDVLVTLEYQDDHRLRMTDLARKKVFSKSGLTRLVDRLENQGFVKREPCENDRRGLYAVLTPKGQKARETAWPVFEQVMREFWGDLLSDKKAGELTRLFSKIIAVTEDELDL